MKKNEFEMTNLVIWQETLTSRDLLLNDSHTPNEIENGKIENDDKLSSFTPMQPHTNPCNRIHNA